MVIEVAGSGDFPSARCCGSLTELDIGDNQLTDAAARAIADRLPSWPLETLVRAAGSGHSGTHLKCSDIILFAYEVKNACMLTVVTVLHSTEGSICAGFCLSKLVESY